MADWKLRRGAPLNLVLAADARLSTPAYTNDQIWEVRLSGGEPPALAAQTTYGLRARSMRLFPRFMEGEHIRLDPDQFYQPPVIHRFFPNYLYLTFSPFPGIDVKAELWVPDHRTLAGRLRLLNSGVTPRDLQVDWAALLVPLDGGERMSPGRLQQVPVLHGRTPDLAPVVFLTGGPKAISSPYPALRHEISLVPGGTRDLTWVHAATADPEGSFTLARETASRKWEAEVARLELTNAAQVEITTGDPDWNATLAMGQKTALGLIHGPGDHLPHPSFVLSRLPDHGFSLRGDGSDYDHLWNGQTALESWYLARTLLRPAPKLAEGLLRNFLAVQREEGYLDWKPGLAGQRSRMEATPILARLAWEIYTFTGDRQFLEEVFPELLTFVLGWFGPYHDRDNDGVPEWDHPLQTGLENHPMFGIWGQEARGVDITTVESPALCALLYQECRALVDIAHEIDRLEPVRPLRALLDNLKLALESAWQEDGLGYRYWDRDSHRTTTGQELYELREDGTRRVRRRFDPHARLVANLRPPAEEGDGPRAGAGIPVSLTVYGRGPGGEKVSEELTLRTPAGPRSTLPVTTQGVYSTLYRLKTTGLPAGVSLSLATADLAGQDISQLLPLWAGIPTPEQARLLVEKTLTNPERYWRPFGLPTDPVQRGENAAGREVQMVWNALIGEGLLTYGFRAEAAALVSRLLAATAAGLESEGTFRGRYDAESGAGRGERNALRGLPPLTLFLHTLGVRPLSPWKVALEGANPFPWPVKVKYRGLTVQRGLENTRVTFPDGQSVDIEGPRACVVER